MTYEHGSFFMYSRLQTVIWDKEEY